MSDREIETGDSDHFVKARQRAYELLATMSFAEIARIVEEIEQPIGRKISTFPIDAP